VDVATLGNVAKLSQSFAKAVWYKEIEFRTDPANCAKDLMDINQHLDQPEAARGVLQKAVSLPFYTIGVQVSWYEMLNQWDEAFEQYENRLGDARVAPGSTEYFACTVGKLKCLLRQGRWVEMDGILAAEWATVKGRLGDAVAGGGGGDDADPREEKRLRSLLKTLAGLGATAAWSMTKWEEFDRYVAEIPTKTYQGSFYRAVIGTKLDKLPFAQMYVDRAAKVLVADIKSMANKSYGSVYEYICKAQQLVELEEIIKYKGLEGDAREVVRGGGRPCPGRRCGAPGPNVSDVAEASRRVLPARRHLRPDPRRPGPAEAGRQGAEHVAPVL
jgi:FKBP12-rapamycin complex-associated protein